MLLKCAKGKFYNFLIPLCCLCDDRTSSLQMHKSFHYHTSHRYYRFQEYFTGKIANFPKKEHEQWRWRPTKPLDAHIRLPSTVYGLMCSLYSRCMCSYVFWILLIPTSIPGRHGTDVSTVPVDKNKPEHLEVIWKKMSAKQPWGYYLCP